MHVSDFVSLNSGVTGRSIPLTRLPPAYKGYRPGLGQNIPLFAGRIGYSMAGGILRPVIPGQNVSAWDV